MPDKWLLFLLVSLACYRLATLLTLDEGPFHICEKWRSFLFRKASEGGRISQTIQEAFQCPFCLGVWIALALALIFFWGGLWWLWWLAIAGLQSALVRFTKEA